MSMKADLARRLSCGPQAVSVERLSRDLLRMPPAEAAAHLGALQQRELLAALEVQQLQREIRRLGQGRGRGIPATGKEEEGVEDEVAEAQDVGRGVVGADPDALLAHERERDALLQRLAVSGVGGARLQRQQGDARTGDSCWD